MIKHTRLYRAVTPAAARLSLKSTATGQTVACSSSSVYRHEQQAEFGLRAMFTCCSQVRLPSTEALAATDKHWLVEGFRGERFGWGGHSASDVCINLQTLVGSVERQKQGGGPGTSFVFLLVLFFGLALLRESPPKLGLALVSPPKSDLAFLALCHLPSTALPGVRHHICPRTVFSEEGP